MKPFNPFENSILRAYFLDVKSWHGHIRLLGLPTLKDNPDIEIDQLFVAPALSDTYFLPDSEKSPVGSPVFECLAKSPRLVVLGDPGSGKSTLVNWVAWRLAAGLSAPLPDWLTGAIPIPLVLRELDLAKVNSFDDLLTVFLSRPVAQAFNNDCSLLVNALRTGKALVLVDGLDEVPQSLQERLQKTLLDGFQRYSAAYWIITSRLVGYEEVALDVDPTLNSDSPRERAIISDALRKLSDLADAHQIRAPQPKRKMRPIVSLDDDTAIRIEKIKEKVVNPITSRAYVLPFDEGRIKAFSSAWYAVRSSSAVAGATAGNFLQALERDASTWRLARNPQLLTLMALVFRSRLQLPEGRALLYEDIAQAYLESIDASRGMKDDRYPWKEKKRWLARVAFEMQLRRVQTVISNKMEVRNQPGRDLLFSEPDVLTWIQKAMERSGYSADEAFAREYLSHIARRSGLLLPRGEGQYAFLHLTFQEYFSAVYVREQVCSPGFAVKQTAADDRVNTLSLKSWATDPVWRETITLLFELVGQEPDWAEALDDWVFRDSTQTLISPTLENIARIDSHLRLVSNVHTGLSGQTRDRAIDAAFQALNHWDALDYRSLVGRKDVAEEARDPIRKLMQALLSTTRGRDRAIASWNEKPPGFIVLSEIGPEVQSILRHLHRLPTQLRLDSNGIHDIEWLVEIAPDTSLLWLDKNPITDISSIAKLHRLTFLSIEEMPIKSLDALSGINSLEHLYISFTPITDITPLSNLTELETLSLSYTTVKNVDALRDCSQLKSLYLRGTSVKDLSALMDLTNLIVIGLPEGIPKNQRQYFEEHAKALQESKGNTEME